jgi:hypothetical protein
MELLGILKEEMEYSHNQVNLEWRRCLKTFHVEVLQRMNFVVRLEKTPLTT